MNKHTLPKIIAVACLLATMLAGLQANAAIKCWTNNEGIRECGNRVPPEYAQQGHQELSNSGMVVDEQERAKTKEELAEQARQQALLEEEKRKLAEQKRNDEILLATFINVSEIEDKLKERITAIDASITLANKQIETIQQDLDKRILAAAEAERAGKTPNDALLKDIQELERQINVKKESIADLEKTKEDTSAEYAANIRRFKELKGIQ